MSKTIIDISQFNTITSMEQVVNSCDGVIVRVGYRGYGKTGTLCTDKNFKSYIEKLSKLNANIGVYFLSQAISSEEVTKEVNYIINLIKDYSINLGVWFDSEWSNNNHTGRADSLSKANRTKFAKEFCDQFLAKNYLTGIYASEFWFKDKLDYTSIKNYNLWVAKYSSTKPNIDYFGWQYTDKGKISGISGNVDISYFNDNILNKKEGDLKVSKSTAKVQMYKCKISDIKRIAYVPMSGSHGETVSKAATRVTYDGKHPSVIFNAELFNVSTYKPSSGLVANGVEENIKDVLGVSFINNKVPALSYKNGLKSKDWIGAYPMLVRDGKVVVTKAPSGLGGDCARTAFCWNDEYCGVVFAEASNKTTLTELAKKIVELGFDTAINLDGGGSTACVTPLYKYEQNRPVRGKIGIWLNSGEENILAKDLPKTKVTENKQLDNSNSQNSKQTNVYTKKFNKLYMNGKSFKIAASALNVRDENGKIIDLLYRGYSVTWYGYYYDKWMLSGIWYYVKLPNGKNGYVNKDYLRG